MSDGTGVFGTNVNRPELPNQEGGPVQPTWNSTLSRSTSGFACSNVAVQIVLQMITFLGELHGEVVDPVMNNLHKQD